MKYLSALVAVTAVCTAMVEGRQIAGSPPRVSHGGGAETQHPAARAIVQEIGLPAMDRGLRDQDPPRAARARQDAERFRKDGDDRLPYTAGSVIVKYKDDPDDFEIIAIPPNTNPEAIAATMQTRPDVEFAQPRYRNYAMARPNDELYSQQWNFPAIDMERAWDIQPGASSNIIVAVLDSGMAFRTLMVRYNSRFAFRLTENGPLYPALGLVDVPFAAAPELGASGASRFVSPRDFIWDDELPVDLDGHGTHVAGTIGQLTNNNRGTAGMAYNVRLMPVKIIQGLWDEIFSSPFEGTDDVVARGIRYAADNGAKVLNLSVGRTEGGPAPVVADALRYAVSRGCFVAIASGNTRDGGNQPNRLAQLASDISGVVAVGAVGRTLDAAYYSTTGSFVEIAAPGGDQRQGGTTGGILQQTLDFQLLETYERPPSQFGPPRADAFAYEYFQGTSMATPHVSGFAALLMQQGITNPAAIEAAMKQFATDKGAPGKDDQYGHGLINPRATLRGLGLAK
jgi:serine protease